MKRVYSTSKTPIHTASHEVMRACDGALRPPWWVRLSLVLFLAGAVSRAATAQPTDHRPIPATAVIGRYPTRIGQQFYTTFGKGDTLTAAAFYGATGVEYPTYEEAVWNNPTGMILVKNKEWGGASQWEESILWNQQFIKEEFPPLHENYGLNQRLLKTFWQLLIGQQYHNIMEMGASEQLIRQDTLTKIGKIIADNPKITWKLHTQRVGKDIVVYSLFAYPPRFYGDPVWPPLFEIITSIDNAKNPKALDTFHLKLDNEVDMNKFEAIGIHPKYIQ